jgi:CubicO group peptidase (beta-lactamase class C family)
MELSAPSVACFEGLDGFIEREYIDSGRLAGAQLAISHRGSLHEACFGHLDRERTRAMTPDALFRIYSMTKPITSVAFMMLVEEGLIGLEDPVSRYLPAWSNLPLRDGQASSREMRIVDLLCHTSGLTYGIQYRTEIDAMYRKALSMNPDGQALEDFIAVLGRIPLEFDPGTVWNYSVSTDVLAHLIEKVSGRPFQQFLRQRLLDPLGMTDTDFVVPASKRARLAECYVHRAEERLGLPGSSFEGDRSANPTFFSGGGGLVSTVKDYLEFCRLILNQGRCGEARLLSRKTLQMMSTNHLPRGVDLSAAAQGLFSDAGYAGIGFGLGWATTIDPRRAQMPGNPGDAFWSGMANTFFWCDPSEDLSCVFMTQILPSNTYPLQRQIKTLVYRAIEGSGS